MQSVLFIEVLSCFIFLTPATHAADRIPYISQEKPKGDQTVFAFIALTSMTNYSADIRKKGSLVPLKDVRALMYVDFPCTLKIDGHETMYAYVDGTGSGCWKPEADDGYTVVESFGYTYHASNLSLAFETAVLRGDADELRIIDEHAIHFLKAERSRIERLAPSTVPVPADVLVFAQNDFQRVDLPNPHPFRTGDLISRQQAKAIFYSDAPCRLPLVDVRGMFRYMQRHALNGSELEGCWFSTLGGGYTTILYDGTTNHSGYSLALLPHALLHLDGSATIVEPNYDSNTFRGKGIPPKVVDTSCSGCIDSHECTRQSLGCGPSCDAKFSGGFAERAKQECHGRCQADLDSCLGEAAQSCKSAGQCNEPIK